MAATSAAGLIGILGWCVDDFCSELSETSTLILKEALAMLLDPEDEAPETYEKEGMPYHAARGRAGIFMLKKELSKRGTS